MRFAAVLRCLALARALLVLASASPAREHKLVPRIIGGTVAPDSKFEYTVFVRAKSQDYKGRTCTGSLIAPKVVLTAAHCTKVNETLDYQTFDYYVGFGHKVPEDKESFGYSTGVTDIIRHPEYNRKTQSNDIALLFLYDAITNDIAKTVKIYTGDFYLDTPLTAAGYGYTDPRKNNSYSDNLLSVNLRVGKTSFCKDKSSNFNDKKMLCTDGTGGKDTCTGDSGGPLITPVDNGDGVGLLGITSFGGTISGNVLGDCGRDGQPGYYTRPSAYIDWIAKSANVTVDSISITNKTRRGSKSSPESASRSPAPSASGSKGTATSAAGVGNAGSAGDAEAAPSSPYASSAGSSPSSSATAAAGSATRNSSSSRIYASIYITCLVALSTFVVGQL